MNLSSALKCFAVVIYLFLLLCPPSTLAATERQPNVLFLICDDLNCDLGAYGHPLVQSPNIDRLARRGMRFDRAYCQYPLCGPSRASFMSGFYPDQTLIRQNVIRIRERIPNVLTMSQLFQRAGHTATRIGKIYHYQVPSDIGTEGHDDPQSWDITFNPIGRDKTEEGKIFTLKQGHYGATLSWLAAEGVDEEQTDGVAATQAAALLAKHARENTPFFMAVGLYRPHTPYVAPKKYFDLYPLDQIQVPQVPKGYLDSLPKPARRWLTNRKEQVNLADDLARQAIQAYYASISFADAQLGRILAALQEHGLQENTIVVFTSDHGYHMGEHGHYQKTTLFENAARVPLIIAVPGMAAVGQNSTCPVEMIDFYPTLAELAGIPAPDNLSGVSLVPILDNPDAQPRKDALTQLGNGYSLRTPRYRYTEWGGGGTLGIELYDHESDPGEMNNLAGNPEFETLQEELAQQLLARITAAKRVPAGLEQRLPARKKKR